MNNPHDHANDWDRWTVEECERSPSYRQAIDDLRRRAPATLEDRPLADFTLLEREARITAATTIDPVDRPGAWKGRDPAGRYPLARVERYLRRLRRLARRFHGDDRLAGDLHALVATGHGYRLSVGRRPLHPAPTGPVASALAAYRTGVAWGAGATAMRQMERAYRPQRPMESPPPFTVILRPPRASGSVEDARVGDRDDDRDGRR